MFESSDDVELNDELFNGIFEDEEKDNNLKISSKADFHISSSTHEIEQKQYIINDGFKVKNKFFNFIHQVDPNKTANVESWENNLLKVNSCELTCNTENKHKLVSSPEPLRSKKKRKFPGPAGLLPEHESSRTTPIKLHYNLVSDKSPNLIPDELCSQSRCSGSILEEEPWQNLLADLGSDKKILNIVNVASVKRKAAAKYFIGRKVPFLAAILHHLDVSSPDPCIILRDNTGEIHGTLHRDVWEQFGGELIVGSVLVIRNVGLLSTGISSRRHYLNITTNNLVTIYSAKAKEMQKTKFHPLTPQYFAQTLKDWCALVRPSHGVGSPDLLNLSSHSSSINNPVCSPITTNPSLSFNIPRSDGQQKYINSSNPSMTKSITSQNMCCNSKMNSIPNYSARNVTPRVTVEKNLPSSFMSNNKKDSSNISNPTKEHKSLNKTSNWNFIQNRSGTNINGPKQLTSNVVPVQNMKISSIIPNSFNFDPVIIKSKIINKELFSKCESERQSIINNQNNPANFCVSPISTKTSSFVVLPQSSQLTAEEQSVVDSVFEGIDADSLFDDDF